MRANWRISTEKAEKVAIISEAESGTMNLVLRSGDIIGEFGGENWVYLRSLLGGDSESAVGAIHGSTLALVNERSAG